MALSLVLGIFTDISLFCSNMESYVGVYLTINDVLNIKVLNGAQAHCLNLAKSKQLQFKP